MWTRLHRCASLVATGTFALTAWAQTPPPMPPVAPASAVPAASGPLGGSRLPSPDPARRLSPAEMSANSRAPDEQRPARAVVPQIAIPLGRGAAGRDPGAPPPSGIARPAAPAAPGAIDDAAARCESRADEASRSDCRRRAERLKPM